LASNRDFPKGLTSCEDSDVAFDRPGVGNWTPD